MALPNDGDICGVWLAIVSGHDERIGVSKSLTSAKRAQYGRGAPKVDFRPVGRRQPQLIAFLAQLPPEQVKYVHHAANSEEGCRWRDEGRDTMSRHGVIIYNLDNPANPTGPDFEAFGTKSSVIVRK